MVPSRTRVRPGLTLDVPPPSEDNVLLLQEDVLRDESRRAGISDLALLSRALFERVYSTMERRALPLQVASPLVRFCDDFSRLPSHDPRHAPALRTLMKVVRTRWPRCSSTTTRQPMRNGGGGVESASDEPTPTIEHESACGTLSPENCPTSSPAYLPPKRVCALWSLLSQASHRSGVAPTACVAAAYA